MPEIAKKQIIEMKFDDQTRQQLDELNESSKKLVVLLEEQVALLKAIKDSVNVV